MAGDSIVFPPGNVSPDIAQKTYRLEFVLLEGFCVNRGPAKAAATVCLRDADSAAGYPAPSGGIYRSSARGGRTSQTPCAAARDPRPGPSLRPASIRHPLAGKIVEPDLPQLRAVCERIKAKHPDILGRPLISFPLSRIPQPGPSVEQMCP